MSVSVSVSVSVCLRLPMCTCATVPMWSVHRPQCPVLEVGCQLPRAHSHAPHSPVDSPLITSFHSLDFLIFACTNIEMASSSLY